MSQIETPLGQSEAPTRQMAKWPAWSQHAGSSIDEVGRPTRQMAKWPAWARAVALVAGVVLAGGSAYAASNWSTSYGGGKGEPSAEGGPVAPGNVTATCTSATSNTVQVAWNAVSHATSYNVWESTTSSSSGYSEVVNVSGTSWTSGALGGTLQTIDYWFEVTAQIGNNWLSGNSAATSMRAVEQTPATCS